MKDIESGILTAFKTNPSKELDTSELASQIFPEDYKEVENVQSQDKNTINDAKRKKFQLHRKLLYYLNKLVDENILKISRIKEKGEKVFALAIEEGNITLEKGYRKIIIAKPVVPSNFIEQYEHRKVMKKFDEDTWINKFNSILLESSKIQTLEKMNTILRECLAYVNDVIAINEFNLLIEHAEPQSLQKFIDTTSEYTQNFDKTISLIIDPISVTDQKLESFIEYFANVNPKNMNIVFDIDTKGLNKKSELFEFIIARFADKKIKINIKNKDLYTNPFFKGRAGIYNFDEEEWKIYQKTAQGTVIGLSCAQSAIAINVNKFFEEYKTDADFRNAAMHAAKMLLSVNTIQRRKSNEYFKSINALNHPRSADFYHFSRNYIRFWNYDWHRDFEESSNLMALIKSTKELVDNFCYTEETIFKSCGIPIRFRIAFSSAFRNFDATFMGEREYKKANVKNVQDFYQGEIKHFLSAKEKMFDVFDGGDRMRIFRTSDFKPEDIIHEFSTILSSFKIPYFTYDFSTLRGMVKLTNFM
jgi:hypothetical protein